MHRHRFLRRAFERVCTCELMRSIFQVKEPAAKQRNYKLWLAWNAKSARLGEAGNLMALMTCKSDMFEAHASFA